jgi:hypothetical protein
MLTWTLAFIGVAALMLAGSESPWVTLLLATRVGVATIVIAALLAGAREMRRQPGVPCDVGRGSSRRRHPHPPAAARMQTLGDEAP